MSSPPIRSRETRSHQAECDLHDWDRDVDVDLGDYAGFQHCFRGESVSPPGDCRRSGGYRHDGDFDGDVDLADYAQFQECFTDTPSSVCLDAHDFDTNGQTDGQIDLTDYAGFSACLSGPGIEPPSSCERESGESQALLGNGNNLPPSGTFALHGRPVDVLSDGHTLFYIRARYYAPKHARWLQRDPTGYTDGFNLYEAFRANATRFTDPMGTQAGGEDGFLDALLRFFERIGNYEHPLTGEPMYDRLLRHEGGIVGDPLRYDCYEEVDPAAYPIEKQMETAARQAGVRGGTLLGEVVLISYTGGIGNVVVRHGAIGGILAAGDFAEDWLGMGEVQTGGEFATNAVIYTGASAGLEGFVLVGGRVLGLFRQSGRVVAIDMTESLGAGEHLGSRSLTSRLFGPVGRAHQWVMGSMFGAKQSGFVLGSGISPGSIPGRQVPRQLVFPFMQPGRSLAGPGEDLFVGTYGQVRRWNRLSGLSETHVPHHVVQSAVSPTSPARAITINLRSDLHVLTRSYGKPVENLPTLRVHLARDVRDLRAILRSAECDRQVVNPQMRELIRQNRLQWESVGLSGRETLDDFIR